ncbi:MAG TPA: hypothetical protein VLA90_06855, partial [Actinomycetota bacterium]|nr:hypothetical protein [Actinomycetota bacterium]
GSVALIGSLPMAAFVGGAVYGAVYLAFVVALVAATAGLARSADGAGGIANVELILLPIAALAPALEPWSPSALVGAPTAIADGDSPAEFVRAAGVTLAASAALLWVSTRLLERREV